MTKPIPLEQAWEELLKLVNPLGPEQLPVDEASGRYLAQHIEARRTQPSHDLSAMDGFAVAGDGPWSVVGESRAGAPFSGTLQTGQSVKISTGAHVPGGTESILLIEDAVIDGETVRATEDFQPGRHIRRAGFDFTEGQAILQAGERIGPARIALIRSAGHGNVQVARRPLVAILECGDELVPDPANCPPGRLPASNGAMLEGMVLGVGADVLRIGPVADHRSAMIDAFEQAKHAHLVITSGGASVGEHDLVKPVLEELGADISFWKVAIRPGKPLLVAQRDSQLLLGLPGNPVSSFVTCFLFALPAIRAMQGASKPIPQAIPIPAGADIPSGKPRREFLRGQLTCGAAMPIGERDSSALLALSQAELLIDRPIDAPEVKRGTSVPCYWLEKGAIA